ncbi:Imm7 family immunity protein [Kribbella qitaiheensis]|uniref:Imm7 family immunity protein n=1 Tax=Kribbella qitaiheensis TaxID=1544730 RepID=UPI003614787C
MFEWHGWATIVASPEAEDDAEADGRQRGVEARVARAVAGAEGVVNETLDLRHANGSLHLWLAGSHNHRDETVIDLFRSVARIAPGSYGVMYVFDDDVTDTWERWVMRRGSVTSEVDASLSPHVGIVEDPYIR